MAAHCAAMVGFLDAGAEVFDYGNSLRAEAQLGGFERAFDYPGFLPAYIRPLFCEGKGPFRWVALSGDPADIAATDRAVLEELPDDSRSPAGFDQAAERVAFQGLPARICWLGYGERRRLGLRFNEMVRSGEVSAPIVIGRDHLDSGSVASPYRETEAMADESDAIADWPLLNALVNTAAGATWVCIHHGGGVGIGRSIHAGMVCVADGSELAAAEARARAHERPGHGRDPPRRRRLRRARSRSRPSAACGCRCAGRTRVVQLLVRAGVAAARTRSSRGARRSSTMSRSTAVVPACRRRPPRRRSCAGVTLPGFVNAHSHCFHRALRGRTQQARGSFWTWREQMYELARVARSGLAARARAGDVRGDGARRHHAGRRVPLPAPRLRWHRATRIRTRWARRSCRRRDEAGLRLTLLDACYLDGGIGHRPSARAAPIRRSATRTRGPRGSTGRGRADVRFGAAIHSVRAVDPEAAAAVGRVGGGALAPLHAHVCEQPRRERGMRRRLRGDADAVLLERAGALSRRFTAVHATHASEDDSPCSAGRSVLLPVPYDRARPRGRDRPRVGPCARRVCA